MRLPPIVSYYIRYSWQFFKSLLRAFGYVFLLTLPFSGFTIFINFIRGFVLGKWFHEYQAEQPRLFAENMITFETLEWFKEPYGENYLHSMRAPYHIPRLYNPLTWTQDVGSRRHQDWKGTNVLVVAYLNALYRERSWYSSGWHHWIYLSANEAPLSEPWNEDPWDKAFLELLQHRDMYEDEERWNFNYITCPQSYLCSLWRVDGPALIHLTNEPLEQKPTQEQSRTPILDPVHVRIFDLPLNESVIPGRFPTRFEQMRSITASNSTYWMKKGKYSEYDRLRRQSDKLLTDLEDKYPKTLGMLAQAEDKWTRFTGADTTYLIHYSQTAGSLAGYYAGRKGADYLDRLQTWWRRYKYTQSPQGKEKEPSGPDPVAQELQGFLDAMSEEDKEAWGKTYAGGIILDKIQKGLEKKDWDGRDDILADIEKALGPEDIEN
ncbi:uncharacterized protein FIESC28_00629 [Fusarium coffeatum]|uniref:Uncharacterized protein n=1 Tax=Fusarium coffeatum TaxID=231269 RepID=A0A366SB37_9HYPO|nr:uncharacterized protein FIESC28_00629 [Fusarium coffeatum]RBR26553.1 hypothetical protein FIESC28_00629 [Fusarium coffeatum]